MGTSKLNTYCITIEEHPPSVQQSEECKESLIKTGNDWWLDFHRWPATTPTTALEEYKRIGLPFGSVNGYPKSPPKWKSIPFKLACSTSHYKLWERAAAGETLVISEHDALFVERLKEEDLELLLDSPYTCIALYWPWPEHKDKPEDFKIAPVKHGAQSRCYLVKPEGGQAMIDLMHNHYKYMRQNDCIQQHEFPGQAGFYRDIIISDTLEDEAKRNLNTSKGW